MARIIFHIDVNSAYLSWEAVERLKDQEGTLDLRTIPSIVGGDMSKRRGVVLAKSLPAKKFGVRTGEPVSDALKKCPELVMVPPRHSLYSRYSKGFLDILREYSSDVEQYSIDEAFMDVTQSQWLFGGAVELAHVIKDRIRNELGFTVNVGISGNKLLAKMASDFEKPDKVHTLFREEIKEKMWPLPVGTLFSVGRSTEEKLRLLGICTIGELANTDVEILTCHLKKQGKVIWEFANGIATDLIAPVPPVNKGYGNSTTLAYDVTDSGTAKMILLSLTESVCARLRKDGMKGQAVSVTIKNRDFKSVSHQTVLPDATDITSEVHRVVCSLFDELWENEPIRLLGVRVLKVTEGQGMRQLSLFDHTNYEKLEKMDKAIDDIRKKFGKDAIIRASFLDRQKED